MKVVSGYRKVMKRIIGKVMGEWLGKYYFGCGWSRRIDNWIEELVYNLWDNWFEEVK